MFWFLETLTCDNIGTQWLDEHVSNHSNTNQSCDVTNMYYQGITKTQWRCEFESWSVRCVQKYVIKFVSDLRQVGGFLRIIRFPPPINLTPRYNWNIVESGLKRFENQGLSNLEFCYRKITCIYIYIVGK